MDTVYIVYYIAGSYLRQTQVDGDCLYRNIWCTTGFYIGTTSIYTVNDISDGCSSTVSSFADDVKIFRKIKSTPDSDVLQNDLKLLEIFGERLENVF